jgi:hypothetical protein
MDPKSFEKYEELAFPGGPGAVDSLPRVKVDSLPRVKPENKTHRKGSTYRTFSMPAPWDTQEALSYLDRKGSVNNTTPPSFFLHVDNSRPCSAESNNSYPTGSGESGVTPPS